MPRHFVNMMPWMYIVKLFKLLGFIVYETICTVDVTLEKAAFLVYVVYVPKMSKFGTKTSRFC